MRSLGAALTLAVLGCLVAAASAGAAFPGINGRIAFAAKDGLSSINPDGSGQTLLGSGGAPAWSPGGTRLAYVSGGAAITVINADGTGQKKLTVDRRVYPAWSPDGQQIVYTSLDGDDLRVINSDGSGDSALTSDFASDFNPAWSPDGKRIAFERWVYSGAGPPASVNIYSVNPDGGNLVQITSGSSWPAGDGDPNWSPEGQRLAIVNTGAAGGTQIHVINADGSGRVNISGSSNADSTPAWSPDGAQIVFNRGDDVYAMNADGTNPRRLATGAGPDWGSGQGVPEPLSVTLTGRRSQRLDKRNRLNVSASCNRECVVTISASVRAGGKRIRSDKRRGKRGVSLGEGKKVKLYAKFLRDPARAIRRALGRKKRLVAKVEVKATLPPVLGAPAGPAVTAVRQIKVRYP